MPSDNHKFSAQKQNAGCHKFKDDCAMTADDAGHGMLSGGLRIGRGTVGRTINVSVSAATIKRKINGGEGVRIHLNLSWQK